MNRDDIIRHLLQAADDTKTLVTNEPNWPLLMRFAALVAAEKDKQIAELRTAISVQAAAVRTYQSTERAQAHEMLELARKLRAESRPDALESERAANAQLTEELEKATELAKCGECGKSAAEGWALYCVSCCEESIVQTAVKEEREECAKVLDKVIEHLYIYNYDGDASTELRQCANAIRARGEK